MQPLDILSILLPYNLESKKTVLRIMFINLISYHFKMQNSI